MTRSPRYGPPWALSGCSVLVVGLARSGLAAARLCVREGAHVTVTDSRGADELDTIMLSGLPITSRLGGHVLEDFTSADLIIVSPGVPLSIPELVAADEAGVTIIGEVELAASFLTKVPMLAVTGTNGKSTTTALVGAMLGAAGRRTFTGGNLGKALSEAVLDSAPPDALALELSSFQLDTCRYLRPDVAVILNLTPDHLDRHGSYEAYAKAKSKLLRRQRAADAVVAWGDDPRVLDLTRDTKAGVHLFVKGAAPAGGAGFKASPAQGHAMVTVRLDDGEEERFQVRSMALRGPHNMANSAAAALACRIAGVSPEAVQQALDSFPGLPHRLELVRVREGVEWINDSKATNPSSAEVALLSFSGKVVWIVGGRGKGSDYSSLVRAAAGRVKALLAIGEDGPLIAGLARGVVDLVEECLDLASAVASADEIAGSGDVVLLSPACASYDQFESFEHRGAEFRRLVEALQ